MAQLSTDLREHHAPYMPDAPTRLLDAHKLTVTSIRPNASAGLAEMRVRERNYRRGLVLSDMLAALSSVLVSLFVIGGDRLRPAALLAGVLVVVAARVQGLYGRDELVLAKSTLDELPRLFHLATLIALLVWLSRHFTVVGAPTTQDLLVLWTALLISLAGGRMLARRVAARTSPVERCVMLGELAVYRRLADRVAGERHLDLIGRAPLEDVVSDPTRLEALVEEHGVQRIIIAPGESLDGEQVVEVIRHAKSTGLRVSLLPSILTTVGSSVAVDDLGGIVLLGVPRLGLSRSSAWLKRAFDLVGASVLALLSGPVLLVAASATRRNSPGPVFFRQLVDVIRGEMSLVGPRPLIVQAHKTIGRTDRRRLHLTPGITGHWQILGAAGVPLAEMAKLDYLYAANWSLWGDVKIIARTVPAMVARRGT